MFSQPTIPPAPASAGGLFATVAADVGAAVASGPGLAAKISQASSVAADVASIARDVATALAGPGHAPPPAVGPDPGQVPTAHGAADQLMATLQDVRALLADIHSLL